MLVQLLLFLLPSSSINREGGRRRLKDGRKQRIGAQKDRGNEGNIISISLVAYRATEL